MRRPGPFFDQEVSALFDQDVPERYVAPTPARRARTPKDLRRLERELDLRREDARDGRLRRERARELERQGIQQRPPNRRIASGEDSVPAPRVGPEPIRIPRPVVPRTGVPRPDLRRSVRARAAAPEPAPPEPRRRPTMPGGTLARNSAVMAGGTFLSRLTGFARVLLVATVLGTSGLGDAYNLANSVPNIVYDLLLGGILSATLVPVFVEEFSKDDIEEGDRAISVVLTTVCAALAVISVALYFLAPLVLRFYLLLNHGSAAAAERAVGTSLLRMFAPQVLLLGAIVVSTALLNARRRFAAAAFSPVANNLIAIAAILATRSIAANLNVGPFRTEHRALLVLGLGTTLGYLVQLLLQIPSMRLAGISLRPSWNLHHPAVRRVASLSVWLIGVVIANQVALNVILVIAASTSGDATVYTTAYQFFQLPYALFTVSVASALTPDLAERWTNQDRLGFQRRVIAGLRVALGILVPAAAGYAIVAQPLIKLAVDYGHVTPSGAHNIGASLALFAIGLPGFSAFVLLMRAFQAMQDTRTMFWMYALENAMTLALAGIFYPLMGVRGLALAWVAPYTVVAIISAVRLQRRTGTLGGALTIRALWRIVFATALMTAVLLVLGAVLPHGGGHVGLVVRLIVQVGAGALVYVGVARALGIEEVEPVLRLLRLGQ
ncbi:MAG: murein biosynthesis integral membrane protein MurJ [Acidimicrobiaceae bacterium]|nr:murein biosynthesis integral membrane protein MurJ [Acidimicrobiaceae bacterium]